MKCPECGERMVRMGISPFYQDGENFDEFTPIYLGWDCGACGKHNGATWKGLKEATWKIGGFFGINRPAFQPTAMAMTLAFIATFIAGWLVRGVN